MRWNGPANSLLAVCLASTPLLAHPGSGIAVDAKGRVFFVDTGGGIFRIDAPGRTTRLRGPAFHFMTLDPEGRFVKAALPSNAEWELRAVGSDPALILSSDFPVALSEGALFYPWPGSDGRIRIHRLVPEGRESVRATLPFREERLRWLGGLAAGPDGAVGKDGSVTVAASGCSALLRISPRGETTVLLRTESPWSPTGVALDGENAYVLEYTHAPGDDRRQWLPRVRKLSSDGKITVLAAVEKR